MKGVQKGRVENMPFFVYVLYGWAPIAVLEQYATLLKLYQGASMAKLHHCYCKDYETRRSSIEHEYNTYVGWQSYAFHIWSFPEKVAKAPVPWLCISSPTCSNIEITRTKIAKKNRSDLYKIIQNKSFLSYFFFPLHFLQRSIQQYFILSVENRIHVGIEVSDTIMHPKIRSSRSAVQSYFTEIIARNSAPLTVQTQSAVDLTP